MQGGGPPALSLLEQCLTCSVLWQTGDPVPVIRHAARQCFADCPRYVLDRLAELEGVPHERTATELQLIHRLIIKILPDLQCQSIIDLLLLRSGGTHEAHLMSTLPEEAIEDLLPTSESNDVKACFP